MQNSKNLQKIRILAFVDLSAQQGFERSGNNGKAVSGTK
jgi:hypothetical protein